MDRCSRDRGSLGASKSGGDRSSRRGFAASRRNCNGPFESDGPECAAPPPALLSSRLPPALPALLLCASLLLSALSVLHGAVLRAGSIPVRFPVWRWAMVMNWVSLASPRCESFRQQHDALRAGFAVF